MSEESQQTQKQEQSNSMVIPEPDRITSLFQAWVNGGKEGLKQAYQPSTEKK